MAKDPAFLFYAGDWLGGTLTFTRAHKGAYMDLLMAQFGQRKLTLEDVQTILGADFEVMWESKLKAKFKCEDGLYWNEKLDLEIEKRKNFTKSRRNNFNGSKDKEIHTEAHIDTHIDTHTDSRMENENENENEGKEEKEKKPKKEKKPAEPKINFAQEVSLMQREYDKLVLQHGKELTQKFIEKLDWHKKSRGTKYKSDYATMFTWVIKAVMEEQGNSNYSKPAPAKRPDPVMPPDLKRMQDIRLKQQAESNNKSQGN